MRTAKTKHNKPKVVYTQRLKAKKGVSDSSSRYFLSENADNLRFVDLFCGIGGFRVAADSLGWRSVFSCDIDKEAQRAYKENFGELPHGDIKEISADMVPDHDVLLAGFPCQPFSIIGTRKGFSDTRGTLFFDIARILESKKPKAFVLENVKQLVSNDGGRTLKRMLEVLTDLKYSVDYRVVNALDYGLPQKRERVIIVGMRGPFIFHWPSTKTPMKPLGEILEDDRKIDEKFYASERIRSRRTSMHKSKIRPSIWHENKSGHISSYPFSCALRANGSYNYLLVDGKRRLTEREMLRLQGFPDSFKIVCNYSQTRKQAGNAVPVPIVKAMLKELKKVWPIIGKQSLQTEDKNLQLRISIYG